MMVRSTFPVGTKVCTDCLQERPLTEFRRRYRDSDKRHNQCRGCFAKYMRYLRAVKRGKLIRKFVAEVKTASNRDVLTAMCVRMAQRLGGVDALCAGWVAHLHAAAEARPGSKMVLDTFRAIVNLMAVAEQQKPEQIDVRELTDDELHFRIREEERRYKDICELEKLNMQLEAVEQLIQSEPEFAIAAAARLGWTVIPPGEDGHGEQASRDPLDRLRPKHRVWRRRSRDIRPCTPGWRPS